MIPTKPVVKNTTPERLTVQQLLAVVGDKVIARWEALGQTDDKIQWQYGAEADAIIPEFPPMVVYKAIAIKTGRTSQTIRKAYYTYKAFTAAQREQYNLVPYSVFAHARMKDNPEEVLKYYVEHQSTPDEIEEKFPIVEDEEMEKAFKAAGLDRIFYSVFREMYGIDPFLKARIMDNIREIQDILRTK